MEDFTLYFELGWQHILDWQGYDHMLFVAAMCASYVLADWRKLLLLVSAFTLGHSLTLALSVFRLVLISSQWVEFLIPLTIAITSLVNILRVGNQHRQTSYALALGFGFIHGLGFSNYLKSLLGQDSSIVGQLFAFNIGLEVGQLLVVFVGLLLSFFVLKTRQISRRNWILSVSSVIFGIALVLISQRIP